MKSKNKNLFLKIYIPFVIIISIALIILQILGSKNRVAYLTDFNLNIERMLNLYDLENIVEDFTVDGELDEESIKNYLLTNENITNYVHHFRIRYYDKTFRNNDIYGVYPDLSNLPDYMKNAEMDEGGSPYGNFISDKREINNEEKIDNINYILKIKLNFIIILVSIILVILCIYLLLPYLNSIELSISIIENDNNLNFTNKILNIAFYIYIILLSIIILSSNLFTIITVDDWVYSSNWGLYNIYNFYGYFWHRGRHFVEILIALSMRPFGNILISFGIEPFYALKISNAVFILIYYYLISISVSLFIWILNNKRNYKLTWLTTFLFTLCLTGLKGNWTFLAAYIASAGIALLIWLPMLYYFIYEKEFILGRNKILYYSIFTYLIYFATFTIEPTSLTISGLSLFILIYYINIDKKIFAENHSSKPKKYIIFFLILFIISTVIAFLLTLFSGRGKTQIKVVDNSSLIDNIINAFADFGIFEKFLILFAVIYIIFLISKFIKLKKISKIDYIYFSVLFVALLGIFGFSAIKLTTYNILLEFLLIFIVLLLILLKNINNKTIWNAISSFIIIGLIIIMGMQVYIDYDNHFKSSFYKDGKSDYKLLQLFIEADKLGNSEIILTKEDIKNLSLESHNMKNYSEELPNIYISNWMLYYGYTKKLILIRVED